MPLKKNALGKIHLQVSPALPLCVSDFVLNFMDMFGKASLSMSVFSIKIRCFSHRHFKHLYKH